MYKILTTLCICFICLHIEVIAEEAKIVPVQEAETSPVQETEISPAQETETSPVQEAETSPVQEAETSPVQEAEISPAQETETSPAKQKEEKSELAKLMHEIDVNYKTVEAMSGWYKYKKKHWKIIQVSAENMVKTCKIIRKKFSRPDDWTYQELNEKMQIGAEKLLEVAIDNKMEGALEEAQWQVRILRRTCAKCHKHLDIHIYPQLYDKKSKK